MKKKIVAKVKKSLPVKKTRMKVPMQVPPTGSNPMGGGGPPMMKTGGSTKKKGH